jgi:hypothetical protein
MCRRTLQDNASYHKKQETYDWFKSNRRYVEVFQLPPYWPELNATERIWNYTRKRVTHNRFFEQPQDLCDALFRNFDYVRHNPQEIENLLRPFFDPHLEPFMCGYIARIGPRSLSPFLTRPLMQKRSCA